MMGASGSRIQTTRPARAPVARSAPDHQAAGAPPVSGTDSPLLTDLYQLNMLAGYLDHARTQTATFEFFVRRLPDRRGFLMATGLEQALDFLESLSFPAEDVAWLQQAAGFNDR